MLNIPPHKMRIIKKLLQIQKYLYKVKFNKYCNNNNKSSDLNNR